MTTTSQRSMNIHPTGDFLITDSDIEQLRLELFQRASRQAPDWTDAVEFGKDLTQDALAHAWRWLESGRINDLSHFRAIAFLKLSGRWADHMRQTDRNHASQSIQSMEEVQMDSLEALTVKHSILVSSESLSGELLERVKSRVVGSRMDPSTLCFVPRTLMGSSATAGG